MLSQITPDPLHYMGGATIEAGGHYTPPSKGGEERSKYTVYILYACDKKCTLLLHVYSMR